MKKLLQTVVGLFVLAALMASPIPEESHQFQLRTQASLCGVTLEPGEYSLVLHEHLADVYRDENLLVTAKAKVTPLGKHQWSNTVYCCGNVLMIVRLEKLKVVFPAPLGKPIVGEAKTQTGNKSSLPPGNPQR